MTVQDLIAKLQKLPHDMPVRLTAVHGEIDTQVPCIEVGGLVEAADLVARGVTVRRPTRPVRWARQP